MVDRYVENVIDDADISKLTRTLVENIKTCDAYKNYVTAKNKLENNPALKIKIDEYRNAHLQFQAGLLNTGEASFDEEKKLSAIYFSLILDEDAKDFLEKERAVMQLVTGVCATITYSSRIDLSFVNKE